MNTIGQLKDALHSACPHLELREQELMSRHTSFRIGGPVTLMALPQNEEEASLVLRISEERGIVPYIFGNGSNLLVADEGLDGFAIKYQSKERGIFLLENGHLLAHAGEGMAQVAVFAMEQGLSGMEFAQGIPGSMGGSVCMNAGAYEGEMSQIVEEVTFLTMSGERQILRREELDFAYRHSVFFEKKGLIVAVELALQEGDRDSIQSKMRQLAEKRRSKQPLELPSGGSTFKRPVGYFAAALIDQCGLKGKMAGGAQVSNKHAGFVINRGDASCADVLTLMADIKETVLRETGVVLEAELRILGTQKEGEL